MLKKLLKYEALATAQVMLPLYGGMALLALAAAGLQLALERFPGPVLSLLSGLAAFLTAFAVVAVILGCVLVNARQFYNLLGQRGYLYFTLPVSPSQHMGARLISSVGFTLLTFVVLGVLSKLTAPEETETVVQTLWSPLLDWLILALFLLLGLAFGYLLLYLCMAIGAQWPHHRLAATVASYFIIGFILQAIAVLAVFLVGLAVFSNPQAAEQFQATIAEITRTGAMEATLARVIYGVFGAVLLCLLAADVLLWFITRHLITKRLNLA